MRGVAGRVCRALLNVRKSISFWLILLAVLIGVPTLAYPLAHDQAAFYYVGRFALAGHVPFRDAFECKPPGIFTLNALAVALFGLGPFGIRFLDMLATVLVGVVAVLALPGGRKVGHGAIGASVLLSVTFYCCAFQFSGMAQPERFEGLLLLISWAVALRLRSILLAAALSGLCSALAMWFKNPALVPALGVALVLGWRIIRSECFAGNRVKTLLLAAAAHVLAGCLVAGLCVSYFVAVGALQDLYDGVVTFPLIYQQQWTMRSNLAFRLARSFWVDQAQSAIVILLLLALCGVHLALRRREHALLAAANSAALMLALCCLSVIWQGKYFPYHWIVATPFLSVLAAVGIVELVHWRPRAVGIALGAAACCLLLCPAWHPVGRPGYARIAWRYTGWQLGLCERRHFFSSFSAGASFDYCEIEELSETIRQRARPGDQLHVRGFMPMVYALTDLPSPSRFFGDHMVSPAEDEPFCQNCFHKVDSPAIQKWRQQHWDCIWQARPRFFVCQFEDKRTRAQLYAHGYHFTERVGCHVLFEIESSRIAN